MAPGETYPIIRCTAVPTLPRTQSASAPIYESRELTREHTFSKYTQGKLNHKQQHPSTWCQSQDFGDESFIERGGTFLSGNCHESVIINTTPLAWTVGTQKAPLTQGMTSYISERRPAPWSILECGISRPMVPY
jgi:hypothetical protein